MKTYMFRAEWPVTDIDMTLSDIITIARLDLPDLLFDAGAQLVGVPSFTLDTTGDTFRLVCTADAEPWEDALRTIRQRKAHARRQGSTP